MKESSALKAALSSELKENPFLSSAAIEELLKSTLSDLLDSDVEEFVNGDDYYEPWMPDYDCQDVLDQFCKKYGLEVLDYNCDGDTSNWQRDY